MRIYLLRWGLEHSSLDTSDGSEVVLIPTYPVARAWQRSNATYGPRHRTTDHANVEDEADGHESCRTSTQDQI